MNSKTLYLFIDEPGDPYFYNRKGNLIVSKEGCSKVLILGFIKTEQPELIRQAILEVRNEISKDTYFTRRNIFDLKKISPL